MKIPKKQQTKKVPRPGLPKRNYDTFIGIDNGASGSIGVLRIGKPPIYIPTPAHTEMDYQKTKPRQITRVTYNMFQMYLQGFNPETTAVLLERPMINPERFFQSIGAARAYESELIALEQSRFLVEVIDSKEWQYAIFGQNTNTGSESITKTMSRRYGKLYYPKIDIGNMDDYDGILIAHFARLKYGK